MIDKERVEKFGLCSDKGQDVHQQEARAHCVPATAHQQVDFNLASMVGKAERTFPIFHCSSIKNVVWQKSTKESVYQTDRENVRT